MSISQRPLEADALSPAPPDLKHWENWTIGVAEILAKRLHAVHEAAIQAEILDARNESWWYEATLRCMLDTLRNEGEMGIDDLLRITHEHLSVDPQQSDYVDRLEPALNQIVLGPAAEIARVALSSVRLAAVNRTIAQLQRSRSPRDEHGVRALPGDDDLFAITLAEGDLYVLFTNSSEHEILITDILNRHSVEHFVQSAGRDEDEGFRQSSAV